MKLIYFNIIQFIIILIAILRLKYTDTTLDSEEILYQDIVFNGLIIPLLIYYTIGHLIFTKSVAKSIGWIKSPFQIEVGYFTLALLIMMVWSNYINTVVETKIALSYVWIIFIMLCALNHIYYFINGNKSINNIIPIFVSIITSSIVIQYSYEIWH
jgi:hypothetical protein